MTKVLNLDDLETGLEKVIVVKGVEHRMTPLSVEDFVAQMKEIDTASEKALTAIEMYELSLRVILRGFPTLPEADLRRLNTFQVDRIYAFLKDTTEDEADAGLEAARAGEQTGAASS